MTPLMQDCVPWAPLGCPGSSEEATEQERLQAPAKGTSGGFGLTRPSADRASNLALLPGGQRGGGGGGEGWSPGP